MRFGKQHLTIVEREFQKHYCSNPELEDYYKQNGMTDTKLMRDLFYCITKDHPALLGELRMYMSEDDINKELKKELKKARKVYETWKTNQVSVFR